MFTVRAKTTTKLLTLSRDFLLQSSSSKIYDLSPEFNQGLDQAMKYAQFVINGKYNGCVPICDYNVNQKE